MCKSFSSPQSINASLMNIVVTLFGSWQNTPPEPLLVNLSNWWHDTSFLWHMESLNSHEAWQCNGHWSVTCLHGASDSTHATWIHSTSLWNHLKPIWCFVDRWGPSWSLCYNRNITWKLKKCWTVLHDGHLVSLALNVVDCDLSQFLPDVSDYDHWGPVVSHFTVCKGQ